MAIELYLPGMNDFDMDYCQCGLGWPMGYHHDWDCPAQCACGSHKVDGSKKIICAYHSGMMRVPVGPSVMTERWDLPEEERRGIQQDVPLVHDTEREIQGKREGEEASGPPSLSCMRRLPK